MRILFDSKQTEHKTPFGCITPKDRCHLRIRIPTSVKTTGVSVCIQQEDGTPYKDFSMLPERSDGVYDTWQAAFSLWETGLYFYYFRITGHTGTFRLFKYGDDTNMEDGDLWQLSCIPGDFTTPDWAKGAVIYQIFPDRFCKSGNCDLSGKLEPYTVHQNWDEEVSWQPDEKGEVLNNDFFGGNFRGITEKLPYIASLGTTILYLNPISKSFSSHRYDTGDYKTPDPMLGTAEDFAHLCREAHDLGIRVILDGVYSHTGSDSLYFDKKRSFGGIGAYCSSTSPYYSWYQFSRYPDSYNSWWGFDTLPTVNKLDPAFMDYIITGENSVVAHWLRLGADGFRLDVADELPDAFIAALKRRIREIKPDALLIGEVWEDASNKISYNTRRRYFTDGELDSVMNYPFRTAILNFLRHADDGSGLKNTVMTVLENYPAQVVSCNMNLLGTHDTPRILTALVDDRDGSREELASRRLTPQQRQLATDRLLLATVLQYTLPGCPSVYYGDEAGMEGGKDPFNRRPYPWGKEDKVLTAHHRRLGQLRKRCSALRTGETSFFCAKDGKLGFSRSLGSAQTRIYVNRSNTPWVIPTNTVLLGHNLTDTAPDTTTVAPMGFCITEEI